MKDTEELKAKAIESKKSNAEVSQYLTSNYTTEL
jgi:hypothetical protein